MYSNQPPPRQDKHARDEIQRSRILTAAKHCFVRHGFHGASMSELAGEAGISVGLIYRYFKSKEDVIAALVGELAGAHYERIVAARMKKDVLNDVLDSAFEFSQLGPDARNLVLEIHAEAARNPAIAEIVANADQRLHAAGEENVRNAFPNISAESAKVLVECFAALNEGMLLRQGGKNIANDKLRSTLHAALTAAIEHLQSTE